MKTVFSGRKPEVSDMASIKSMIFDFIDLRALCGLGFEFRAAKSPDLLAELVT